MIYPNTGLSEVDIQLLQAGMSKPRMEMDAIRLPTKSDITDDGAKVTRPGFSWVNFLSNLTRRLRAAS